MFVFARSAEDCFFLPASQPASHRGPENTSTERCDVIALVFEQCVVMSEAYCGCTILTLPYVFCVGSRRVRFKF